jgi:hypothetical protein
MNFLKTKYFTPIAFLIFFMPFLRMCKERRETVENIDQSQSLNLMIHPDTTLKEVNALFYEAWKLGIKTLYYQRSVNMAQKVSRDLMNCSSCEA